VNSMMSMVIGMLIQIKVIGMHKMFMAIGISKTIVVGKKLTIQGFE